MNHTPVNMAALVTEKFIASAPAAAARMLEGLATHEACQLLSPLKAQSLLECLEPMQSAKAAAILRRLPVRQGSYVLSRLSVPKAAELMAAFSGPFREKISQLLPPKFIKLLEQVRSLPALSAGACLKTDFISFKTDAKLPEILERLKGLPRKQLPLACVVTAKDGALKGVFRTAELAFCAPASAAGSIMSDSPSVRPETTLAEAARLMAEQELALLPVTDEAGALLGVLYPVDCQPAPGKKKPFWKLF